MKNRATTAVLAGLITCFYFPHGWAQESGSEPTKAAKGDVSQMGMRQLDRDSDGLISRDEFMQAHEDMFHRMDKDGDGFVKIEEMHQGMDMMGGCMAKR